MADDTIYEDFECLNKKVIYNILEALCDVFNGKDFEFEMESEYMTDWFIAIESNLGNILIRGEDDGPCNTYDPYIKTNIFSMKEEKEYCFHIDDMFG